MEYREPLLFVSVSIILLAVKYACTKVKECELFILQTITQTFFLNDNSEQLNAINHSSRQANLQNNARVSLL